MLLLSDNILRLEIYSLKAEVEHGLFAGTGSRILVMLLTEHLLYTCGTSFLVVVGHMICLLSILFFVEWLLPIP